MAGYFWNDLEVTTAFTIANIPSMKFVLQKHLPAMKEQAHRLGVTTSMSKSKTRNSQQPTCSTGLSSVSTQRDKSRDDGYII